MSGQMTHLKTILAVLSMMAGAVTFPVQAVPSDSECDVTSGILPLTNINLKSTGYKEGDTLQEFSFPIAYTCKVYYDFNDKPPSKYWTTLITTSEFGNAVDALKKAGLAMDIHIQEEGQPPQDLLWDKIKNTGGGSAAKLTFGDKLPMPQLNTPESTSRSGKISGRIFAQVSYQGAPVMIHIQQITALNITPDTFGRNSAGTGIMTPDFYIRIFPDNLGEVSIEPSTVDFGRIYPTSVGTLTKTSPPFTVTAKQKTGTPNAFDMPLDITFDTGGLPLTDNGQAINLSNGLKLSVTDTQTPQEKIIFNKTYYMDTIHFQPSTGTHISKTYTAQVEPTEPGAQIKTGKFSAAVTVRVTYQ
ncbi:fimbrial protein [Salmonella enterica subsp. arizonae]|nr:fimbrial protein [Salmonella enterica subsp. arizonae]